MNEYPLRPIGFVESPLTEPQAAPRQGDEGSPDCWLIFNPDVRPALDGLRPGDDILVITWLHLADRTVLQVHPRSDISRPMRRVRHAFAASAEPAWRPRGHDSRRRRPAHARTRPRSCRRDTDRGHQAGARTPWETLDAYEAIASNSLAIWAGATSTLHCWRRERNGCAMACSSAHSCGWATK